jgi:hypothetical protein
VADTYEHNNEPSVAIRDVEFVEQLNSYWLLEEESRMLNLVGSRMRNYVYKVGLSYSVLF